MSQPTRLEGELRVRLQRQHGCCSAVQIESSRPDVARHLLQGRSAAEVLAAVPMLFSVCARSQAAACGLALAAAGYGDAQAVLHAARSALRDELLRESACQVLLQWPRWVGEQPGAQALAAARIANQGLAAAETATAPARTQLEQALFGMRAADWLALADLSALDRWVDAGQSTAARTLRILGARGPVELPARQPLPPLLPAVLLPPQLTALARCLQDDVDFARRPVLDAAPAETGALSRWQHDTRTGAWLRRSPDRLTARLLARLHETAALLTGCWQPGVGTLRLGPDQGLAWVDNARGLLVHMASLHPAGEQAQAADYRIIAPTEWNFHPAGALTQGLLQSPADDADEIQAQAMRLIHSLDPCVTCRVELCDA